MRQAQSITLASAIAMLACAPAADACSRVTYLGPNNAVITGRTMDWMIPIYTNLWAFPAGVQRNGAAGANSLTWTAKYGSVISASYDAATTDGMNEKGLVANLLYLSDADYGQRDASRPGLSVAAWAQYVLDNFATVADAVASLEKSPFQLASPAVPGGYQPTMHLAISDRSGDSAIFESVGGKMVIHHGRKYQVMTNEPPYDQQLALNAYWTDIGGAAMLPGTDRPADRFVRASYYLGQAPQTAKPVEQIASVYSIMRNVSVPMGVTRPGAPNIAPTLWRTVSDQTERVYYFEDTQSPNIFWVSLDKIDLKPGAPILKLDLSGDRILAGDAAGKFAPAPGFTFMVGT
jgi:penicillin V acylase-like amidase (Ntn superfamily)